MKLKIVHAYRVKNDYYLEQLDAKKAAEGQGEWGGDETVTNVQIVRDEESGNNWLIACAIELRDSRSPAERQRVLKKLSPYERRVLGVAS
jgi:hypothetical protein